MATSRGRTGAPAPVRPPRGDAKPRRNPIKDKENTAPMSPRHMVFDPAAVPSGASRITVRHVNYPIQGKTGMQEVPGIPA